MLSEINILRYTIDLVYNELLCGTRIHFSAISYTPKMISKGLIKGFDMNVPYKHCLINFRKCAHFLWSYNSFRMRYLA